MTVMATDNMVEEVIKDIEDLDEPRLQAAGRELRKRFEQYKKDRRQAELQWVKNLRQYEGEWDPEVVIPEGKSRAYPRLTRQKCLGMVARLMALLFPEGEANWGVRSSERPNVDAETLEWVIGEWVMEDPQAVVDILGVEKQVKKFADRAAERMSIRIRDQLSDTAEYGQTDYPTLARKVIESAIKYGVGVLKGPMTIEQKGTRFSVDDATGNVQISNESVYRPYFEFVRLWDYYPDMHAKTFEQMDGEFYRHVMSKHQLRKLSKRDDFYEDKITKYLANNQEGDYEATNADTELHSLETSHIPGDRLQKGKYEVVEYWGPIDVKWLEENDREEGEEGEVIGSLWMLGREVIKAARSPYREGVRMFHVFLFEDDDVNLAGKGLPQVMRDSQMGVSNSTRMMMDNASAVCGPMAEVNVDLLVENHKPIKFEAFEIIYKEGEGSMGSARAITNLTFDAHLNELLATVQHFRSVADDETFVNSQPGGDMSGEALRTQGNMSMVMGNSSLPFRDIVRNYDNFTVSLMHSLIQWNHVFDPETHIDGDLRPIATGSTTLMAKEVRAYALDNMAQTITEDEKMYIDMQQFALQRVKSRDLPDTMMLPDDKVEENRRNNDQIQEQIQQLQQQMQMAELRNIQAQAEAREADALKKRVESGVALPDGMQQVHSLEPLPAEQGEPQQQAPGPAPQQAMGEAEMLAAMGMGGEPSAGI